jgi:hypothetical protein
VREAYLGHTDEAGEVIAVDGVASAADAPEEVTT